MKKLKFYLKYAWRSILRGGQLTIFVIISVAVGVGTLVALLSLTIIIRDNLTGNVQARAGGDIVARVDYIPDYQLRISPRAQELLNTLKTQGQILDWTGFNTHTIQITGYFNVPPSVYIVDPAHFPLYGEVPITQPAGGNFNALLSQPNSIILSKSLMQSNNYQLGQELEVSGVTDFTNPGTSTVTLKIVGVMDPTLPGVNFDTGLFTGFGMISQNTALTFLEQAEVTPTSFFIKTAPLANIPQIINQLQAFNRTNSGAFPFFFKIETATEVLGESSRNLEPLEDILSYIGLLAVLIGGLGVINTMSVVVRQRTTEIATVKALGLKSRQALTIFTLQVLILGFIGSLIGLVLGEVLGLVLKGIVENIFGRTLEWGLYPAPLLTGLLVGTLASGIFGFIPAYAAGSIPPAVVLRQVAGTGTRLPAIGNLPTLLVIFGATVIGGILAGTLVGNLVLGLLIAFITLFLSLLLIALMYLVVALTARMPAPFGPDFKMALRNFGRHRARTATSLLVITVSLFFISMLNIVSDSIKTTLDATFSFDLGFNAAAVNVYGKQDSELQATFQKELPGLKRIFLSNTIGASLNSVNQQSVNSTAALNASNCGSFLTSRGGNLRLRTFIQLSGRSLPADGKSISPNGPQQVLSGRTFTPGDADQRVLLIGEDEARCYNLKVGDKLNLRLRANNLGGIQANGIIGPVDLEIIGIVSKGATGTNFEQGFVAPYKLVDQAGAQFSIFFMQLEPSQVKVALTKVQDSLLYKDFVFDLTGLVDTFTNLLNQILAFPLLLSLLSLFGGSLLIANNVALAVLERRTEVGVLKAIGAKRRRVLAILLWENALLALLGAVLGIGGSLLLALLLPTLVRNANNKLNLLLNWSPVTALLILALAVGLAVVGTLVTSWRAVQEKPLVVLRYE